MTTVTIILTLCILHEVRGQTPQQVKSLVDTLMASYDKRIRPVEDQSLPVILDVSLNLISIIGTDEVNEKLETSGYLTIQWDDSLLTWDPSLNDEVYRIFLPQNDIWKPDIVLGNGFKKFEEFGGSFYYVEIQSFGHVYWKPFQVFETNCAFDTTYFPYDKEVCEIVFVVWSYTVLEVEIRKSAEGVDLLEYKESGVWEITHTDVEVSKESIESRVVFSIHIKRKPLYYILNIILPILLLGLLTILVFVLPADSGEKMSYAMTVFLSFAVFLTIVNTILPVSSETTPLLSIYLLLQMTMGVLVLFLTALQIRLHQRDESVPMCNGFKVMVRLVKTLRCSRSCGSTKPLKVCPSPEKGEENKYSQETEEGHSLEKVEWKDVSSAIDFLAFWGFLALYLSLTAYLFVTIIFHS